jgi:hypothetical protein
VIKGIISRGVRNGCDGQERRREYGSRNLSRIIKDHNPPEYQTAEEGNDY